jgi:hypothetical protein
MAIVDFVKLAKTVQAFYLSGVKSKQYIIELNSPVNDTLPVTLKHTNLFFKQ